MGNYSRSVYKFDLVGYFHVNFYEYDGFYCLRDGALWFLNSNFIFETDLSLEIKGNKEISSRFSLNLLFLSFCVFLFI